MTLSIYSLLNLSTGHLSPQTRNKLQDPSFRDSCLVTDRDYGYLVPVTPALLDLVSTVPADLLYCLRLARANDANYIIFDVEGPRQDQLPWYEDNADPDLTGTGIAPEMMTRDEVGSYPDPAKIDTASLTVGRARAKALEDGDYEAPEGLWIGIGDASVRLTQSEDGTLKINVFPLGREMDTPVHSVEIPKDWFEAEDPSP